MIRFLFGGGGQSGSKSFSSWVGDGGKLARQMKFPQNFPSGAKASIISAITGTTEVVP